MTTPNAPSPTARAIAAEPPASAAHIGFDALVDEDTLRLTQRATSSLNAILPYLARTVALVASHRAEWAAATNTIDGDGDNDKWGTAFEPSAIGKFEAALEKIASLVEYGYGHEIEATLTDGDAKQLVIELVGQDGIDTSQHNADTALAMVEAMIHEARKAELITCDPPRVDESTGVRATRPEQCIAFEVKVS